MTEAPAAQGQPDAVPAGTVLARARIRTLAASAVFAWGIVVIVAQPEEPDQPHDQQADVEYPEADHEDPSLRGHDSMLARVGSGGKTQTAYFYSPSSAWTVGRGSGMYVAV